MDWPAVLAELHRQGMTLTELARRNGISPKAAARVKSTTNYKAQQAIAEFLDRKPEDLWPNRYPIGKPRILDRTKFPLVASQKAPQSADTKDAA